MDFQILIKPGFIVVFFILSCVSSGAQKNVADLSPAHASAVQQFIRRQPQLEFPFERSMDPAILKDMRKNFGALLNPFYCVGNFNRDTRLCNADFGARIYIQTHTLDETGPRY